MSEFKHRPGPWHLNPRLIERGVLEVISADHYGILHFFDYNSDDLANAHLIAAAPELLEALTEMTAAMRRYECDAGDDAPPEHRRMMRKACRALAKATGVINE